MLHTSARLLMTGLAAVTLGAMSGWVLINAVPAKAKPQTERIASAIVPEARVAADEPAGPARTPAAAPAPLPRAETPPPTAAPARVTVAPPPAASPTDTGKPRIHIDKDRGAASFEIDDSGIFAGPSGLRVKMPAGEFRVDPDERRFKVRGPGGINFDIDW